MALAAAAAYVPVVVVPYAFGDDYRHLGSVHGAGGSVWELETAGGRPINAAQLAAVFSLTPDLDALRVVRLFGVLGAALLGLLLYYALRTTRDVGRWLAAGISISIITLPSFQVYVAWSVLWAAPYAAMLGGLASLRVSAAAGHDPRIAVRRHVEAVALLLCGLLTYQPAAMFFWVFTAIDVLRPGERLHRATRALATRLGIAVVATGCAYVVSRVGVHFYGGVYAGRTELVRDLVGKIRWFWEQPLVNALNAFELVPTQTLAVVVAIVGAAGILLLHAEKGRHALGFLGLAAVLVPLSYIPNLVVAENFASYRSVGGLSALVMLYGWLGLWGIARTLYALGVGATGLQIAKAAAAGAARVAIAAVALTGVLLAARNVTTLFVKPQSLELQMMRSALGRATASPIRRVVFVKSFVDDAPAPLVRYDEFGMPSSYLPWVPVPAVVLILQERGQTTPPKIDVLPSDARTIPRANGRGEVLVDMRAIRRRRVGWSLWTFHAER